MCYLLFDGHVLAAAPSRNVLGAADSLVSSDPDIILFLLGQFGQGHAGLLSRSHGHRLCALKVAGSAVLHLESRRLRVFTPFYCGFLSYAVFDTGDLRSRKIVNTLYLGRTALGLPLIRINFVVVFGAIGLGTRVRPGERRGCFDLLIAALSDAAIDVIPLCAGDLFPGYLDTFGGVGQRRDLGNTKQSNKCDVVFFAYFAAAVPA